MPSEASAGGELAGGHGPWGCGASWLRSCGTPAASRAPARDRSPHRARATVARSDRRRLAEVRGALGLHREAADGFVVGVEGERFLGCGERLGRVARVELATTEGFEPVDDRGCETADLAGRPRVVVPVERSPTDERERALERREANVARSRVGMPEQQVELVDVDRDLLAIEDISLVGAEDDVAELRASFADRAPESLPRLLESDIGPEGPGQLIRVPPPGEAPGTRAAAACRNGFPRAPLERNSSTAQGRDRGPRRREARGDRVSGPCRTVGWPGRTPERVRRREPAAEQVGQRVSVGRGGTAAGIHRERSPEATL